jgi:AraC-like DNA-binding protein
MQWRAEMVRDYIATTGASNKEAAAEFGFCDEAHLCHVLKGAFNRSPQSFSPRRRARQLTLSLSLKYKQLSRLDKVADLGLGASVVKRNSGSRATVIPRQTIN